MTDFRSKIHNKLHAKFGVQAMYFPTMGVSEPVTVKLHKDVEMYGEDFNSTSNEDQLVLLLSDINNAKKSDYFLIDNVKYYLVRKLKDDGFRQVWSLVSDR